LWRRLFDFVAAAADPHHLKGLSKSESSDSELQMPFEQVREALIDFERGLLDF
jgi:hypothetical protein